VYIYVFRPSEERRRLGWGISDRFVDDYRQTIFILRQLFRKWFLANKTDPANHKYRCSEEKFPRNLSRSERNTSDSMNAKRPNSK